MELPHRQKQKPYLLVTILKDPILYRDSMIHFKTGLITIKIKGWKIIVLFNILLAGGSQRQGDRLQGFLYLSFLPTCI